MINVSLKVSELIKQDDVAMDALRQGLLNLSAYADKIHNEIEELTHKKVKKGTIVVALSRIKKDLIKLPPLIPNIEINNLSVKSSLCAYSYEKTLDIQRKIAMLHPYLLPVNDMLSITEGPSEITVIFAKKSRDLIRKHFSDKPKKEYTDVVAITAQYAEINAEVPNFLYGIFSKIASKHINLIEIVSTYSEITFIVKGEDMPKVLDTLNASFVNKNNNHEK